MAQQAAVKPYPVIINDLSEKTILDALRVLHAVVADPGTPDAGHEAFSAFPTFDDMKGNVEGLLRITNRVGKALQRKDDDRREKARARIKKLVTDSVETHPNTAKARRYRDQWVGLSPEMKEEYPFKKSYIIPIDDLVSDMGTGNAESATQLLKSLGYTISPAADKGKFNLVLPLAEPKPAAKVQD